MTDWNSLVQDFGARLRSQRALPVVHKAFGATPLVGEVVQPAPTVESVPPPKPVMTQARAQRVEDIVLMAARAASTEIDAIRRGGKAKRDIALVFEAAVERQCANILEASKISPRMLQRAEEERERLRIEHKATRKALADELKSGRRRLRELKRRLSSTMEEVARTQAMICKGSGEYPQVPPPIVEPSKEGEGLPPSPGVYFLWRGEIIEYVGKAGRLSGRLKLGNHHILSQDHRISYVCVESKDLTWAESYYIGAVRPYKNFGRRASHYLETPPP